MTLSSILIATSITSMVLHDSQIFSIASKTIRTIHRSFLNNPEFEHDFSSFDLEKYLFPSFTSFLSFFSFYH